MKKYNFLFNLGDKVKVKDLSINGRICGIHIDSSVNITYQVRYFYNSEPKTIYFEADELELNESPKESINFKT